MVAKSSVERWEMKYRGLSESEAIKLCSRKDYSAILKTHEDWRAAHGFPAKDSPIARGHLLDLIK